ncbi:MAG: 2OG-Fe(II) oxygenase [Myxococcales bacterium FL481]|nr:MAG: 2OG-Fe(II) oxygenase [Myxococcales bacterium FL481]
MPRELPAKPRRSYHLGMMGDDRFIRVHDNVVPRDECRELIEMFRHSPYVRPGQTQDADRVDKSFKVCDELFINEVLAVEQRPAERKRWQAVDDRLFEVLDPLVSAYNHEHRHLYNQELAAEGFRIKRYPKGLGRFGDHIDATPTTPTRVFALILYLNDVADGGETEYPVQGVKVAPRAGRFAIFPCTWTYPHRGCTPLSNDKFIINNFLCLVPRQATAAPRPG